VGWLLAVIVVLRRFFRGLAQGQAEMKKTGSKRGSGYESGLGSAVLTAPEESYASEADAVTGARGTRRGGPAPAGALQRGYGSDEYSDLEPGAGYAQEEPEYVPRRGMLRLRFRGLPRSVGGRIVFGVVVFGVLATVAVAVAGMRYYLMHDSRFLLASSDDIQIQGAEHLTREQVLAIFGADLERNIFRVPLVQRQADLERLPWVAHAAVMRLLPGVLRVQITERTPVAFVRQGTQIGLVDGSGVLLDMPPDAAGDPHYSFPVLTGLATEETVPERTAKMEIYQSFMKDLDSTGQHLTDSVSEADVSDPEDVKALVTSGSSDVMVHFGQEEFLKRYQEFEQHLQEWKLQYPKLASADMRYEGQIVLEMQGDGQATVAVNQPVAAVSAPPATAAPVAKGKAVSTKPAASVKTAVAKPVAAKVKRPVAKKIVAKGKAGSGVSAANARVFARLAAEHRAALAKAHKTATVAKKGKAGGKSGVTP
jgi:cell division protein FtsQ